MEFIVGVTALLSLGISVVLAGRLLKLERRFQGHPQAPPQPLLEPPSRPLQGLRIALAISQDHPHPVFAALLKELLLTEDVSDVTLLEPNAGVKSTAEAPDILIAGDLVCNGYAEIYYTADFTCSTPNQPICTLIEKPPHGDRPSNLAIELVTRLKRELENLSNRTERRQAIRELQGP